MAGAFLGATIVWLSYLPHWAATEDKASKLGIFATGPAIRHLPGNILAEIIGTAVLVFCVLAIGANAQGLTKPGGIDLSIAFSNGLQPFLVGVLVWGIGLSLGGATGYAINPARDLGPRLAHALLPIAGKGDSDWGYSWIPVLAPIGGGILGAFLFRATGL
jgi:glycerol uptake facilitator protein